MNVICLEEDAFFELVELTLKRLRPVNTSREMDKWISDEEAMSILRIKSKSTLQRLRDDDEIRYSQPMHKVILYDRESIDQYLNKYASR